MELAGNAQKGASLGSKSGQQRITQSEAPDIRMKGKTTPRKEK
jgi:hypothetical protein